MNLLITGSSGYIARYVLNLVRERYPRACVHGVSRHEPPAAVSSALDTHHKVDLRKTEDVEQMVKTVLPDAVVHLASLRCGGLAGLMDANAIATESLLNALRTHVPRVKVVIVGSSAELGLCYPRMIPSSETVVCNPVDDYGISKLAQSMLAQLAYLRYKQHVVRLRLFNIVGPELPETLLAGRCARLLVSLGHAQKEPTLHFGNLETARDYTDVRDVARAIILALEHAPGGAFYNVGSGEAISGRQLVQMIIAESNLPGVTYTESLGGSLLVPTQAADTRLIRNELGWMPKISLKLSIKDLLQSVLPASERTPVPWVAAKSI